MNYYAKLVLGGSYTLSTVKFERNVEIPVTQEIYEYVQTLTEGRVITQGNGVVAIKVNRFEVRSEEPTKQEKALKEIEVAPDTLSPKKPAR